MRSELIAANNIFNQTGLSNKYKYDVRNPE
ncbi:MAG: hypothetical protein BWX93_01519 [Bacteroidetes bacterium ADurb.Bin139]|nr:MAG: hypothetical protein BWX93_01519 [Bacteroidetes bacterium ADurb.Bin139]